MKAFVIVSVICIVIACCLVGCGNQTTVTSSEDSASSADTASNEDSEVVKSEYDLAVDLTKIRRGINMSALEYTYRQTDFLYKESTYADVVEKGFDHIRLPVDFRNFSDKDGNLNDSKMKDVDEAIRLANDAGLVVFLDFHGWPNLDTVKGDDILFMKIWKGVAERYKNYEHNDMLIFELINEPHTTDGGNLDMTTLSLMQCLTANFIREISPNRTICFATADWNGPWTLKADSYNSYRNSPMMNYDNVIVAVHCYATLDFTHQNMAWMNNVGTIVKLDENILSALKQELGFMADFKKETGIPVILNEFGFNTDPKTIPYEDQGLYIQTLVDVLKEHNLPCTWWAYHDGNFGLHRKNGLFAKYEWNDTIVDILVAE